jgi:hypothetical protein
MESGMIAYTQWSKFDGKGPAYGLALTGQTKETIVSRLKEGYSYVSAT